MHAHEVRRVLDQGTACRGRRLTVFLSPGPGRVAVLASRRAVGGAVDRNRARRVLRAAWRDVGERVPGRDAVLVAGPGIRGATTPEVAADLTDVLDRASGAGE